jgi:hypothetical protein
MAVSQDRIGAPLCPELATLYRDHDGMPVGTPLPMRLMKMADVSETNVAIRQLQPALLPEGATVFWTDDNSNYAGAFLVGALSCRVFTLDHEEPEATPRFRSPRTFVAALLATPSADWSELKPDYPALMSSGDTSVEADRELGRNLLQTHFSNPDHTESALVALALLPPDDTELLLPLLGSSDMWVQERACEVLGFRRYAAATNQLAEVARTGMHNGRIASIRALQRMGTREAAEALQALARELGEPYGPYFRLGGTA